MYQKSGDSRAGRIAAICLLSIVMTAVMSSCHSSRKTIAQARTERELISEYRKDDLLYKVFRLPDKPGGERVASAGNRNVMLSIRVINMKDNASPLRSRCTNLDEYNTLYEYLLNSCKNEIYLQNGKNISYPVSYSFENNYNAFPFETINVGYHISRKSSNCKLVYVDRVFSRDTITFTIKP